MRSNNRRLLGLPLLPNFLPFSFAPSHLPAACSPLRLKRRGGCSGYQVEFLQGREGQVDVGLKQLVLLFHPRTLDDDYAPLTEFQRIAAVATLRGTGLVAFNPRLQAYAHHPGSAGGFGGMPCVPMVLSDFRPIFFLSAHTRPANPRQAYAVLMRTGAPQPKGKRAEGEQAPWPYEWEVRPLTQTYHTLVSRIMLTARVCTP